MKKNNDTRMEGNINTFIRKFILLQICSRCPGNDPLPKKALTEFYVTALHHHKLIDVKYVSAMIQCSKTWRNNGSYDEQDIRLYGTLLV